MPKRQPGSWPQLLPGIVPEQLPGLRNAMGRLNIETEPLGAAPDPNRPPFFFVEADGTTPITAYDVPRIHSAITQTIELGYKGVVADKLSSGRRFVPVQDRGFRRGDFSGNSHGLPRSAESGCGPGREHRRGFVRSGQRATSWGAGSAGRGAGQQQRLAGGRTDRHPHRRERQPSPTARSRPNRLPIPTR